MYLLCVLPFMFFFLFRMCVCFVLYLEVFFFACFVWDIVVLIGVSLFRYFACGWC